MTNRQKSWLLLFAVVGVVLLIDQAAKYAVKSALYLGESVSVLPPVLSITHSENTGAAFGFLPRAGDLFLILAIVIVIGLVLFYDRIARAGWLTCLGVALVCGGALGNALDRIFNGAVIDFIHYTVPGVVSNVSNLADHAIVIGVLLIVIESFRADARKKPAAATSDAAAPALPPIDDAVDDHPDIPH